MSWVRMGGAVSALTVELVVGLKHIEIVEILELYVFNEGLLCCCYSTGQCGLGLTTGWVGACHGNKVSQFQV